MISVYRYGNTKKKDFEASGSNLGKDKQKGNKV